MRFFLPLSLFLFLLGCRTGDIADLILINGAIHTMAADQSCQCLASKAGKIILLGKEDKQCLVLKGEATQVIDLGGEFAMPGFIEGHGHFSGVGRMAQNLNFLTSNSWEEILAQIERKAKDMAANQWIEGRGWHQEKWDSIPPFSILGYPTHESLDAISPDNPVILFHASGHSLFANEAAMKIAKVSAETPDPDGGKIIRDPFGKPTGVFEENAQYLIRKAYADYLQAQGEEEVKQTWLSWINAAQKECLSKGITSFQDAGSSFQDIKWYRELAEEGKLDLRLWVMLRHSFAQMENKMDDFPMIGLGNNYFTCKAVKSEVDGALGAHGAWLINDYEDRPGFKGQNTTTIEEVGNIAKLATAANMQLCVHAIGDRANREVLNIFEREFKKIPARKDWRWRIEHAQHLDVADIPRFASLNVIASMQGVHCTSDAPFVVKRLGTERAREGGYAWRSLLDQGVTIANGTDAPVEDVDPLPSIYASVTRRRENPQMTFFSEQKMTRTEALHSYTLGNAYAAFEEELKGSLELGKMMDVVVLDKNLMSCAEEDIPKAQVLYTIVDGIVKYKKEGSQ